MHNYMESTAITLILMATLRSQTSDSYVCNSMLCVVTHRCQAKRNVYNVLRHICESIPAKHVLDIVR